MKINGIEFLTNEELSKAAAAVRKDGGSQQDFDRRLEQMQVDTWTEVGISREERERRFKIHLQMVDKATRKK